MAEAKRRGYGDDGIYFDHRGDCEDSAHHRTCAGRWRGVVSLGFDADGKRIRRKVSGSTRTEVKGLGAGLHQRPGGSPPISLAWMNYPAPCLAGPRSTCFQM